MEKETRFLKVSCLTFINGEGGIRTLGTELPAVQQISNLSLSTAQPPLQDRQLNILTDHSPHV
ncbi:hypothetical protein PL8927_760098 [Planktothrix serta PCC 8927]|uniref:Uncharacterized protein n=1 Tax=Planktothrix serta PCC 8927 TaxID=671068 RepID=A0A7Z9C069_9CYAN|nr:hypothetical protein PL8927_760098 [Planktothrix serta PCC 8927]